MELTSLEFTFFVDASQIEPGRSTEAPEVSILHRYLGFLIDIFGEGIDGVAMSAFIRSSRIASHARACVRASRSP